MVVVAAGFHCIPHNYVFTNDSELGKNLQTGFAIGDTKREVKGCKELFFPALLSARAYRAPSDLGEGGGALTAWHALQAT